jgi:ABC-type transport system substrate-binding protein
VKHAILDQVSETLDDGKRKELAREAQHPVLKRHGPTLLLYQPHDYYAPSTTSRATHGPRAASAHSSTTGSTRARAVRAQRWGSGVSNRTDCYLASRYALATLAQIGLKRALGSHF